MFWKGCYKIYFVWCVEPVKEMSIALDSIYSWCENFTSATSVICDAHNLQICILQQAKHIKWPQPILMQVAGAPHPLQSIMLRIIAFSLCNSSKSNKRINNNGIYCTRDVLGIRINASIVTKTFFHKSILGGLFIQRGHTMPYNWTINHIYIKRYICIFIFQCICNDMIMICLFCKQLQIQRVPEVESNV